MLYNEDDMQSPIGKGDWAQQQRYSPVLSRNFGLGLLGLAARAGTGAGDEAERVIAGLHVLPEVHIGVVEDVAGQAQVVEALRRQHHAHIVAAVKQRHRARPELRGQGYVRFDI